MSVRIDCSFEAPQDPSRRLLEKFLDGRIWYETGAETITYADTDTGVGFELALVTNEAEEIEGVSFQLQEGRPEVYGREVGEELAALAEEFELEVRVDGESGGGPDAAVEQWNRANRRVLEQRELEIYPMAAEKVQRAWRWNRNRQDYHRKLAGAVFVPRVLFFERRDGEGDGELQRGVIWPDAIPLALPEVDMLLVSLADQAGGGEGRPDSYLVDYETCLEAVGQQAEYRQEPVEHRLLDWEEAPTELVESIVEQAELADPDRLEGLPSERIFERELVD